jgi:CO/xanthine dehydrogenase Mo-binding subunit
VEGGTLQAVAYGYLEEIKLKDCRYLNDRLTTYIIPTTLDAPAFDTVLLENPAPGGPFGAKGVGELPMDGGAPAVVQAIENATGISSSVIPATPERLLTCQGAGELVGLFQSRAREK